MHAETQINFENIMVSKEVSHKKSHIVWYHLFKMHRMPKSLETENRLVIA